MSWPEIKKAINSDLSVPLDTLIKDSVLGIVKNTTVLFPLTLEAVLNSAAAADITYDANVTLTQRIIVGDTVTINSGVTVTTMTGGVIFVCNEFVNNGVLTAAGKGAPGGYNGHPGTDATTINGRNIPGAGGGSGSYSDMAPGAGGDAYTAGGIAPTSVGSGNPGTDLPPAVVFDIADLWYVVAHGLYVGAGGGGEGRSDYAVHGGAGGGAILIVCALFNNAGTISAQGVNGGVYAPKNATAGGGGGGCIIVDAVVIVAAGTLTAAGGLGGDAAYDGGDGGDGMVIVIERQAA